MHGKLSLAIVVLTGLVADQDRVVAAESYRTYLSQHDIIYQQPPLHSRDGFPIGNRTLAGMVYQEQGHYKVQLVKDDVWDHRSVPQEDITAGHDHRRVLELLGKGDTDTLNNLPGTRFTDKWTGPHKKSAAWTPYPAPKIAGWLTAEAEVEVTGSGAKFKLDSADSVKLMISVVSSFDRDHHRSAAQQLIQHVDDQQLHRLASKHQRQWDDYWSKSRIQLSDKFVENVWYFNVYQMGVSYSPEFSGGLGGPFFAEEPIYLDLLTQTQDRLGLYDGASFSKPHFAMSAAWLHQSSKAWNFLYDGVLAMYMKPNGFASLRRMSFKKGGGVRDNLSERNASAPIFQDICAGAVGVVNEMLLQSQSGAIQVFPALPEEVDAAFDQLRARGAFLVSSVRRQGVVQFVEVQAESGGVMKLVNPWPEGEVVCSDPRIENLAGQKAFAVPMAVGQKITFHPEGTKPQPTIWNGWPATAPRSVVRVIQEKMPAGHRNDPLKPLVKYADQCTIWLGKPKAKMPKEE